MLASFFEVDVWLSRQKGEQTQPSKKRRTARGAGGRAGGTDCTGSPVTALLARPVRDPKAHIRPPATRAKTCARRQFRGREARRTATVPREEERYEKGVK